MAEPQDILLVTLNARYQHCSFGLRYLQANLGALKPRSRILEFTIKEAPLEIAERILAQDPRIVGLGVYIWNTNETLAVVKLLKTLRPELVVVIGGPEVSYEWSQQPLFELCDHLVTGEAELTFAELCAQRLAGETPPKVLAGRLPDTATMAMPYGLYSDEDIANRVIYVEASRGCPFRCEFCLSSLDEKVRKFPLEAFLAAMGELLDRGVRQFKFVDRTFNLSLKVSQAILNFFLAHIEEGTGLFLHFEMIPDRFPEALRALVQRFPPGSLQFEVGIQTFNEGVAARIDRKQQNAKIFENLDFLVSETGVHVHTDLIVGLPGEDLASFGRGFDQLVATGVQEIQVGILKRLRGAPLARHTETWDMVYNPLPPYEILRNQDWSMAELARMRRFARYWDLIANSGRFPRTSALLLAAESPFEAFMGFSDWVYREVGKTHGLSLSRSVNLLFQHLVDARGLDPTQVATVLYEDHRQVTGKAQVPAILRAYVRSAPPQAQRGPAHTPPRQRRHLQEG